MEYLEDLLLKEHKDFVERIVESVKDMAKESKNIPPLFAVFSESKKKGKKHAIIQIPVESENYKLLNDSEFKTYFSTEIRKKIKSTLNSKEDPHRPYAFFMISQVWVTKLPINTDINLSMEDLVKIGEEKGEQGEAISVTINSEKGTIIYTYDVIRIDDGPDFVMCDTPKVAIIKPENKHLIENSNFIYYRGFYLCYNMYSRII